MPSVLLRRVQPFFFLLLCLLSISSAPRAGEKSYPPLLDRTQALSLADSATPQKYPDADEVQAAQCTQISYRPDGTYTQLDEVYLKVMTEKGKQDNRTIASHFTIPYQLEEDCKILLVEIIKPDHRAIPVDLAKNSKLVVDSSDMGANIYNPNDKIIQVNIPGLEIGDVLHYYMYDNTRQPRAAGIYADILMFESTNPILFREARIDGPANFPLVRIAVRDPRTGAGAVTTTGPVTKDGRIYYHWKAQDVPQAFPEPNTPALYSCLQRLMVSTTPDWPTVSRWYWGLCEKPLAATTPEMEKQVRELTAGMNNPADKMKSIFYWVSQNIRYLGITTESVAPGYEPHPVKETFQNRHGVCRDKAALLVAMLRLAGIESYPVLINNGEKKDAEIAQPWFNHAITAAKFGDQYILMDSTDENTKELLPSYLDNRSYLVATPQGEKLRTSDVIPAEQNLLRIETTGALDARGNLRASSILNFEGINDNIYRGYFARLTPEERRRHFEAKIKDLYGEARLTECKIEPENMLDTSRPLRVKLDFTAEDIGASGGSLSLLPLPFLGTRMGMVNFVLGQTGLEKRRFPLYTEIACGVEETVRLTLPDTLEKIVSLPVYKPVENEQLVWKRSLSKVDKSLMGRSSFLLKAVEFSPAQYLELKEALRQIEYAQRKMPLFAAVAPAAPANPAARQYADADAVTLDEEVSYLVLEPGKWVETRKVKKKILTYSGQKDKAEIKIDFNPVWETVSVPEATVTAPDGKMLAISAQEINLMDQPWNGRAPRYPGGKTLVASLPGVAIGSTLEYTIRREVNGRPFFSLAERFRAFDPIARKTLLLTLPKKLAESLNYKVVNASTASGLFAPSADPADGAILDGGKTEVRDTVVWRWSADSAEAVKRESTLPPWGSFTPMVYASTGSWPAYAALVRQKLAEAAANQPAATAKAKEIAAPLASPRQKVVALRNFVAKEIRRVGPDLGELPLSALTPADRTLDDRYGNTADRAILLYAMLSAINLKPEFHITTPFESAHNLRLPQLELANPGVLNSVLVRVNVPAGTPATALGTPAATEVETIWLNDTDQYAEPGTVAADGSLALDPAAGKFQPVTAREGCADNQEILYLITLAADGSASIKKTVTFYGAPYASMKKNFAEMTPEQRSRFQQETLAELSQAARPAGDFVVAFDQYPGRVEFTADVPRFAVRDGQYLYLQLPQTLRRIFGLTADTRTNPLFLNARGELRISTLLSLPPEFTPPLVAPKDFKWRSPAGDTSVEVSSLLITPLFLRAGAVGGPQGQARAEILRELSSGRNLLFFSHLVRQTPAVIAPALYPELLEAQNALSGNPARTVLFQLPSGVK